MFQLSLGPRAVHNSEPRAKAGLEGAQQALGFIPNMYVYMANAPILLDSYLHAYKLFREESNFTPIEQEVVFLTISRENGCEYCVAAHSFVGDVSSKVPVEVTDAIRDGRSIPDSKLQTLSAFTREILITRGRPNPVSAQAFLDAGYKETDILNIVQAIGVKIMSNYTNHLFGTPLDEIFRGRAWRSTDARTICPDGVAVA